MRSRLTILLLAATLGVARPATAEAQAVPAAYGLITGTISGVYVSTGIFVAKARAGSFLYSLEDALTVRWELAPAALMPLTGVVMGIDDGQRLAQSIKWGGIGFATGAAAGLGVGLLLSNGEGRESEWSGAIIGSAAGLLVGSIYGALSYDGDDEGGSAGGLGSFTIRVPL